MERLELVFAVLVLIVEVFALINCVLTPDGEVKHVPKALWILFIIVFPLLGGVLWLAVGRDRQWVQPRRVAGSGPSAAPRRSGYAAYDHDDRIRAMEEDLRRLERESDDDGRRTA